MANDFVRKDNHRHSELFGDLERSKRKLKAFFDVSGRKDYDRMISVGAPSGLHEVPLCRTCGHAGRRTHALHINNYDRNLTETGIAYRLLHKREARTRCSGHGLFARQ